MRFRIITKLSSERVKTADKACLVRLMKFRTVISWYVHVGMTSAGIQVSQYRLGGAGSFKGKSFLSKLCTASSLNFIGIAAGSTKQEVGVRLKKSKPSARHSR